MDVDLDEKLVTDRPEEPFDLPPSFGAARFGVDQPDTKNRTRAQQRGSHIRGAVIEIMPMSA
ncbi:MAG: hypothetical protein WAX12_10980 [Candidatus Microthrix subdominans]